ncbi:hypothetical protein D3C78_1584760 [compost metagenome]
MTALGVAVDLDQLRRGRNQVSDKTIIQTRDNQAVEFVGRIPFLSQVWQEDVVAPLVAGDLHLTTVAAVDRDQLTLVRLGRRRISVRGRNRCRRAGFLAAQSGQDAFEHKGSDTVSEFVGTVFLGWKFAVLL